jgi:hypothetical protein
MGNSVESIGDWVHNDAGWFGSKPAIELPSVPTAPELDAGAQKEREKAALEERRRISGRASTVLTGGLGDTSKPQLASKVLLGQ